MVKRVFRTGETLFGVIETTLVGSIPTVTVLVLSVIPLTVTLREGVVEDETSNLLVIHLIRVDEMETTLQTEPSLKVTE
jgi:hypothetical protein